MSDTIAMLQCNNGGIRHNHSTVEQILACYGMIPAPALGGPLEPATEPQVEYVRRLGGDVAAARGMSKRGCSDYINSLKKGRPAVTMPTTGPAPKPSLPYEFVDMIRDGYYAAREDTDSPWKFFFVSRPKSGRFAGAIKVQMQHGSYYGGRWSEVLVAWPSKKVSVYRRDLEDHIKLVLADQTGCALAYASEIKRCCRCNAELTDMESRKYGIGPECVKHWPWIIEEVNARAALAEMDDE